MLLPQTDATPQTSQQTEPTRVRVGPWLRSNHSYRIILVVIATKDF